MFKLLTILLLLFVIAHAGFNENGKNEIGGILAYSNLGDRSRLSEFQLSPFYNYYFTSHLAIGPIFSIFGTQGGSYNFTEIDFGARVTLGFELKNSFLYLAPGCAFVSLADRFAFGIPTNFGIKTIIANHFGIDSSLGYSIVFNHYHILNNFGISFGVFGLI